MIKMEKVLQEKKKELKEIMDKLGKKGMDCEDGSLRVVRDRKHYSYYHCKPADKERYPQGKYISKKEMPFIRSLAQNEYDKKLLDWARACYAKLEKLEAIYKDDMVLEIYEKFCSGKRELILPYELPTEQFVKRWLETPYIGKDINSAGVSFVTDRGEKVRSKSEKILADNFNRQKIPYKYECPLILKGYGVVYPDFTLLNKRTRQVWYWEHLGMTDNMEYVQKAIAKIQTYEQNGIFQGRQLLLSYEAKNNLNIERINGLIQEFLI